MLTQFPRRHFFTLTTTDATPERWEHTAEQVLRFTLFWAPLDVLPDLRSPQAAWQRNAPATRLMLLMPGRELLIPDVGRLDRLAE